MCESSVHHPPFLWISLYIHLLLQVPVNTLGWLCGKACNLMSVLYLPHKSSETKKK